MDSKPEPDSESTYSEGDTVIDRESEDEDELFVVEITETPISEEEMYWDSSMNPTMVSEENPSYNPDQSTVHAVYLDGFIERQKSLERYEEVKLTLERARELVDESKLKSYSFPKERLQLADGDQ